MSEPSKSNSIQLKSCPFCGGEAAFAEATHKITACNAVYHGYFVSCVRCCVSNQGISVGFADKETAAQAWNIRLG